MTPAKLDLDIYVGSTFYRRFTWQDRRVPINVTGYTFRMQIRPSLDSDDIIAEISSEESTATVEDADNGVFSITLPPEITSALTHTEGVYDLEAIAPDGQVSRILEGCVLIHKGVTR